MKTSGEHAHAVRYIERIRDGQQVEVDWVSPIVATMLAAERIHENHNLNLSFSGCAEYAEYIGLNQVVRGNGQVTERQPKKCTYSPLARLATHDDVDRALDIVTSVLDRHMGDEHRSTINEVCRIVGELHDNVASHARGAGFSALQVYTEQRRSRVELAVVDAGIGLLANVKRVDARVKTHQAAIHWCLQKGNTTAAPPRPTASSSDYRRMLAPTRSRLW